MKSERLADSRDELYNVVSSAASWQIYVAYVFYLFLFLSFLCLGFLLTPLAGRNCWRTSTGKRTTVWEIVILRIGKQSSYVAYVVPNNCIKTRYKFSFFFCISGLQCLQILF
jgi:hypothetical protein